MKNEEIIRQLCNDPEGIRYIENLIINQNISIKSSGCNHRCHKCNCQNNCNDDFDIWIILLLLFCGCGFGFGCFF
ncbi:hypothetical protein [Clostridium algidicarnis]|uniref:hypothetical protein n=1 Tax=Clostridium algidicarnis TaxID=37659 RepID=UPI001C0E2AC4|nr:hypothetical protein [Clostridium algidicarnis]MBU3208032.1 hypothetical protein [Clostridium algidicarnis]MBU3229099.1 hypothetical protein [Clostridium algidicarnis]MBU3251880.1 hypothetical protein [Clostridium algidicarnis]